MGVMKIAHHPEMTWERAMEIFQKEFGDRYKVYSIKRTRPVLLRDFVVQKNGFVGVSLRLEQTSDETRFVYSGFAPGVLARMLANGLIAYPLWNSITNEIKAFIERAPEFR
jgi:hypothetical protein